LKITKVHIEYFLVSLSVLIINIGLYFFLSILTDEGNYVWSKISPENLRIISDACTVIFRTKYYIWFFSFNLVLAGFWLWYYDLNVGVWLFALGIVFYFGSNRFFAYYLAKQYVIVFEHQKVTENYQEEPLISGGYAIGYFLSPYIEDKNYPQRRAAISGIGKVAYTPAIPSLGKILRDSTEKEFIRGDAYMALKHMGNHDALNLMEDYTHELIERQDTLTYQYLKDVEGGEMY
jgi:hypothetical protein